MGELEVILGVKQRGIENFDKTNDKIKQTAKEAENFSTKIGGTKFNPLVGNLRKLASGLTLVSTAYRAFNFMTDSVSKYLAEIPKGIQLSESEVIARSKQIKSVNDLKSAYDGLKFSFGRFVTEVLGPENLKGLTSAMDKISGLKSERYFLDKIEALEKTKKETLQTAMEQDDPRLWKVVDERIQSTNNLIDYLKKELAKLKEKKWDGIDIKKEVKIEKEKEVKIDYSGGFSPAEEWEAENKQIDLQADRDREIYEARHKQLQALSKAKMAQWKKDEERDGQTEEHIANEKALRFDLVQSTLRDASAVVGMYAENNREMFALNQALSIANATMNTYSAATKAYEEGGPFLGPMLATMITALGFAQVAKIATTSYKEYALGTRFAPGGMALVGERGPEFVNLPRGSQVYNNNITKNMVKNSSPVINFNISGGGDITEQIKRAIRSRELDLRIFKI